LLLIGIFVILLTAALRFGAALLLPIAIACLFTLLLTRPVRALHRLGLSTRLGAALVVFGTVAALGTGAVLLAGPAASWVESAPETLVRVQSRIRKLSRSLQETADKVDVATGVTGPGTPQTVQIKAPGLLKRLSVSTTNVAATVVTVVFLTYFLLAMLPAFRKKLADLIETAAGVKDMDAVLAEVELQMSHYMLINTLTSAGVGLATGVLLALVGLPNAVLWGVLSFLLNFIPYAGALIAVVLIGAAAVVTFTSTGPVLLVVGGCVVINTVEGNLVTPHLQGKHLPLNPVAIFVSLLYWGWVWGAAGALLAVPIMVMVQIFSSRIDRLHPLAVMLDR
jgi:predicted PurR-regulated permease PerM